MVEWQTDEERTGRRELLDALVDLLLAHRSVVAWLARDITAVAQPRIGERVTANAAYLQWLLVGADVGLQGQVRVAAAVGTLTRPLHLATPPPRATRSIF